MRGLSQELQLLVDAERVASRPSVADSERVLSGLQARLGIALGAGGLMNAATIAEKSAVPIGAKAAAATTGLGLVVAGVALVYSLSHGIERDRGAASETPAASQVETSATATNQPAESIPLEMSAASAASQSAAGMAVAPARGTNRPRDSLSEEVAILSRAERELLKGRAANALTLLNEHERKFRNGALAEERTAARIQAFCALGRVNEANALMNKLAPQSLHGERARQACATAPTPSTSR